MGPRFQSAPAAHTAVLVTVQWHCEVISFSLGPNGQCPPPKPLSQLILIGNPQLLIHEINSDPTWRPLNCDQGSKSGVQNPGRWRRGVTRGVSLWGPVGMPTTPQTTFVKWFLFCGQVNISEGQKDLIRNLVAKGVLDRSLYHVALLTIFPILIHFWKR